MDIGNLWLEPLHAPAPCDLDPSQGGGCNSSSYHTSGSSSAYVYPIGMAPSAYQKHAQAQREGQQEVHESEGQQGMHETFVLNINVHSTFDLNINEADGIIPLSNRSNLSSLSNLKRDIMPNSTAPAPLPPAGYLKRDKMSLTCCPCPSSSCRLCVERERCLSSAERIVESATCCVCLLF